MNVLQRLEDAISASLERGFGRLTRAPLQPIDIARRLEQAIEDQQIIASERTLVPDQFWVFVHPQDYAQLQPWAATLETDLCQHLVEQAAARGWVFLTSPYVRVNQGQDVPRRQVRVMAQMSPMSPPSASGVVPLEETSALPAVSAPADPAASPATQYELRSLDGAVAYPLSAQTIDIGRERDNDIILDATGVSRH
ncbi:MAG: DUF3662 domain-containing protein, partial [Chloroflexi bacterium]|nr:DUF3662 domain-containing protein [Chloroflexota bacterium]